jgi:hypothetical protein
VIGDVSLSTSRARFAKQKHSDCIRDGVDSRAWQPTDCVWESFVRLVVLCWVLITYVHDAQTGEV